MHREEELEKYEVELEDEEEGLEPPPPPTSLEKDEEEGEEPKSPPAPSAKGEDDDEGHDDDDDDLEQYSKTVQKRIGRLTAKLREAERRERAATEYAASLHREYQTAQQKLSSLDSSYVTEFENRLKVAQQLARQKLREAIDRGDPDAQVEAQGEIARLATEQAQLEAAKARQVAHKEDGEREDSFASPQPQRPAQARRQPDPKAVAWAARNPWFGKDEAMTLTAFSEHRKLVEEEGVDPTSDEYYRELDRRMKETFPGRFAREEEEEDLTPPTPKRPRVAGQQRPQGGSKGKKITLTKSEVAIARKLNVPLDEYAKQVARLRKEP